MQHILLHKWWYFNLIVKTQRLHGKVYWKFWIIYLSLESAFQKDILIINYCSGWKLHQGPLHLQTPGGEQQEEECDSVLLGVKTSGMHQASLSFPPSVTQGSSQGPESWSQDLVQAPDSGVWCRQHHCQPGQAGEDTEDHQGEQRGRGRQRGEEADHASRDWTHRETNHHWRNQVSPGSLWCCQV